MKKKRILSIAVLSIILSAVCVVTFFNRTDITYNNEMSYDELITYRYTDEELYSLYFEVRNVVFGWERTKLFDVVKKKKIECVRYIDDDISYTILISTSGDKLFISFADNFIINNVWYVRGGFLEKRDFEKVKVGETHISDVREMDMNIIPSVVSFIRCSGHIVKEGTFIITYKDEVVEEITFYENDDILAMRTENYFLAVTPYILPMDKQ